MVLERPLSLELVMESHMLPWPEDARFVRLRILDDGIPRDVEVRLLAPREPGGAATLFAWHRAPEPWTPLRYVVETSDDGTYWVAEGYRFDGRAA